MSVLIHLTGFFFRKHSDLICHHFVKLFFSSFRVGVLERSQTPRNMNWGTFRYSTQIRHVLSFPCCHMMPCGFICSTPVTCLVQVLCYQLEAGYHVFAEDACPYVAYPALKFDFVDVIHNVTVFKMFAQSNAYLRAETKTFMLLKEIFFSFL